MKRRQKPGSRCLEVIATLVSCPDPVSYYDAFVLTRQLRGQEPSPQVLAALFQLHDAEHTTDGARRVLAQYLRALANKQENQRLVARRPITLRDDHKIARAVQGDRLTLHLDERRTAGFRWQNETRSSAVDVSRDPKSNESPNTAVFVVQLKKAGAAELSFLEQRPGSKPGRWTGADTAIRRFVLSVVIDSS